MRLGSRIRITIKVGSSLLRYLFEVSVDHFDFSSGEARTRGENLNRITSFRSHQLTHRVTMQSTSITLMCEKIISGGISLYTYISAGLFIFFNFAFVVDRTEVFTH